MAILLGSCALPEGTVTGLSDAAECRPAEERQPVPEPKRGFKLEICETPDTTYRVITDRRLTSQTRIDQPPQRVVSQSLGSDETLLELLPEGEFERLVAVSALSRSPDYSDHVELAQQVGHFVTDKTEEILSLAPDLVFAASYSTRETVRQLRNADVPTVVLHQFSGIDDAIRNLEVTAFALYLDHEAEQIVLELERRLDRARSLLEPALNQRELRVVAYGSGSVYATGTTFDDVADRVGLVNIPGTVGQRGWPTVHGEQLVAWRPDVVYLGAAIGSEKRASEQFRRNFPALFVSPNPPVVVPLPSKLMTTVSHRLGELAEALAERTLAALNRDQKATPAPNDAVR